MNTNMNMNTPDLINTGTIIYIYKIIRHASYFKQVKFNYVLNFTIALFTNLIRYQALETAQPLVFCLNLFSQNIQRQIV